MTEPKDLAGGGDEMQFVATILETELFLVLTGPPDEHSIDPRTIEHNAQEYVLAFDSNDGLANQSDGPMPYAALPGRGLIAMLAGQGIGLAVMTGQGQDPTYLTPEIVDWIATHATDVPDEQSELPKTISAPRDLPHGLFETLSRRLAKIAGLAQSAYLASVTYADERQALLVAIVGASADVQPAVANSIAEAVRFTDADDLVVDVSFFEEDDRFVEVLARNGVAIDIPEPTVAEATHAAPGMDPDKPPRLI